MTNRIPTLTARRGQVTNKENFLGLALRGLLTHAELYAVSFNRVHGKLIGSDPFAAECFVRLLEACQDLMQFPIGEQSHEELMRHLSHIAKDAGVEL